MRLIIYDSVHFCSGTSAETVFDVTPVKMPTYLLAFVVSDLDYVSYPLPNPYSQRIYATEKLVQNTKSALYYSVEFLKILEEYVDFSYQLPTLYSAALPDHGSAMENYVNIINPWHTQQYIQFAI